MDAQERRVAAVLKNELGRLRSVALVFLRRVEGPRAFFQFHGRSFLFRRNSAYSRALANAEAVAAMLAPGRLLWFGEGYIAGRSIHEASRDMRSQGWHCVHRARALRNPDGRPNRQPGVARARR